MTATTALDRAMLAEMLSRQHDVISRRQAVGSVQTGRCSVSELARELGDGPKTGSAGLRRVLAEVADGIRSAAEAEFRELVQRAGLPMPMFNARLYIGDVLLAIADAWWPDLGVAAEVDSREWHLSAEDWQRTMRRHTRMTAAGILVLHFTPQQIRTRPVEVVTALRSALDTRRTSARTGVTALPAAG
jgi:very-short-patch-repair endonuclease